MSRALIIAPLARNLATQYNANIVAIPNAQNATQRVWDTMDAEFFISLNDSSLTIYTRRQDVPNALLGYLFRIRASETELTLTDPTWTEAPFKQFAVALGTDYIRVRNGTNRSVKQKSALIAGDIPLGRISYHEWQGVADTLGNLND